MKLIKPIFGVRAGQIYPEWIPAGEECPQHLEQAATEAGALDAQAEGATDEPAAPVTRRKRKEA